MIEPFFFDEGRLFGSYSSATDPNADTVVVFCPPLFDEYRRTYRALSELAVAMAERGVHAFRFDYFGTAESQGLLSEASIKGWVSDIEKAIDEAMAVSGADRIILLGVRFGATLAAQIPRSRISRWLFWDPVLSGKQYRLWLEEIDHILHQRHEASARENNIRFEDIAYTNFNIPQSIQDTMSALEISDTTLRDTDRCFTVTTDPLFCQQTGLVNCQFPGISYDWPYYHDGVITQKPVLEALLDQVSL